jgi:hypothetical protein
MAQELRMALVAVVRKAGVEQADFLRGATSALNHSLNSHQQRRSNRSRLARPASWSPFARTTTIYTADGTQL